MAKKLGSVPPTDGDLPFVDGTDYRYSFQYQNPAGTPANWPAGSSLYYLIGDAPGTQHNFTIAGNLASIRIESDAHSGYAKGTPFSLTFKEPGTPTTETVILKGKVSRT